jgi:hypothetical protein
LELKKTSYNRDIISERERKILGGYNKESAVPHKNSLYVTDFFPTKPLNHLLNLHQPTWHVQCNSSSDDLLLENGKMASKSAQSALARLKHHHPSLESHQLEGVPECN